MRLDQAGQLDARRGVLREQVGGVFDQRAEVERDVFQLQLPGVEFRQVENIVEQFHQHLARVVGDRQLLLLLGVERAIQRQCDHPQQTVERCADFMAHVGQKRRTRFGHVQRSAAGHFELFVGLTEAGVDCLEFGGARRDDVFQLREVFGQAVFCGSPLLDFGGDVFELLIGDLDQHADFIVAVAGRALERGRLGAARVAAAELTDDPHQWFGQHHVEQRQEDPGQQQAAGETIEQGDFRAAQEAAAKGVGVDFQFEDAEGFVGQMVEVQAIFEMTLGAEQEVADQPIAALQFRAFDVGQDGLVVVDQLRGDDRRRAQQAEGELLRQFGIDVVGDARGRIVADFQQCEDFPVDGSVFAGIIDADLQQTEQGAQNEPDQHGKPGLLVRQPVGEFDIHGLLNHFRFPSLLKHSRSCRDTEVPESPCNKAC